MDILSDIQTKLKVPKTQWNKFGEYHYRTCEDILEGLKPILKDSGVHLIMTDEPLLLGDWHYIKSTARLVHEGVVLGESTGVAREILERKKMDSSQLTAAASSYARKTALGGLFALDDAKDSDGLPERVSEYITEQQLSQITDMMNSVEADEGKFLLYLKVDSLDKIPAIGFDKAMAALKAKEKKERNPGEEG